MPHPGLTFAQAPRGSLLLIQQLGWALLAGVILMVLGVLVYRLLRRMYGSESEPTGREGVGFTLAELKAMYARGELTDQEFERARTKLLQKMQPEPPVKDASNAASSQPPQPPPG